jgi:hypothetical protein
MTQHVFRLEMINDDAWRAAKFYRNGVPPPSFRKKLAAIKASAGLRGLYEVLRFDDKLKPDFKEINGKRDYTFSNKTGSRGVFVEYIVTSTKLYIVAKQTNKDADIYYCVFTGYGTETRLTKDAAVSWLRDLSENPSLMPRASGFHGHSTRSQKFT